MARPKKSISPAKNGKSKFVLLKSFIMYLPMMHWQLTSHELSTFVSLILDHHPVIKQEVVFDSTEVLEIFRGLGNCRGNLNQIAKHLNQGGEPNGQVRNRVLDCISELYEMRDKLEEMVGEYRGSH